MTGETQTPPPGLLEGAALFLDFDGTLVELAQVPGAIRVPDDLATLLETLAHRLDGRIAIVSGRALDDLDLHIGFSGVPLSGSHGLELRLGDGTISSSVTSPALAGAREEIRRFADRDPGLLVEEKPASIALHFRQAPQTEGEAESFLADLAARTGLAVQRGKMVLELRPRGGDKGGAVRRLMAEPSFAGARPVFVGDDLTDEHGFAAAAALGGAGILVGPPRPSAARYRLADVPAVAAWLRAAADR